MTPITPDRVLELAAKHLPCGPKPSELLSFAQALLAEQAGAEIARRVAPQACPVHPGCGCDPAQECGLEKARAA